MKLTNHIIKQANDKNIPLPVIHKIINEQVSLIKGDLDFGKRDRIMYEVRNRQEAIHKPHANHGWWQGLHRQGCRVYQV